MNLQDGDKIVEQQLRTSGLMSSDSVGLVEKKVFTLPAYTTLGGKTIRDVRIGYETYGKLNDARDNVILVAHYFSGTSHAAGRYAEDDVEPGYWDSIIGPGKAIDTDRFFVISSDTLVNLNVKDKYTVTTGPCSIDPDTGKPYGMHFPIVTVRDFVHVQKALLDSLGIHKLHAVAGPSMGSMQALEWGVAFPDMVERIIAVIPAGLESDPYLVGMLNIWAMPIMLDPKWNQGDYQPDIEPLEGLAQAIKTVILNGRHFGWANNLYGRKTAADGNLLAAYEQKFAIEDGLDQLSKSRTAIIDANSLLYMVKACQLYSLGHQGSFTDNISLLKAKVMLMPAKSDLLMLPDYSKKAANLLRAHGKQVDYVELEGEGGHFDGLISIGQASAKLAAFLNT